MHLLKKVLRGFTLVLCLALMMSVYPVSLAQEAQEVAIVLSDGGVTVDAEAAGNNPEDAVYVANDIVFYLEGQDFTYGEGTKEDEHPQSEADAHTVVHITKPGVYRLTGTLSAGQIAVDLGEDAKKDPEAVVTLILDAVDITCTVAPAVIFYNVYECGDDDADAATKDVDTSAAGANVVIADGSVNNVSGSYVARIYESVELSEDGAQIVDSKKLHKYDGALYSKRSMNVYGGEAGDGVLNIKAENEGLCSDLHLTIHGGVINITSGNDGINASEDYVSVCAINGGEVNITVDGSTGEGDGIDSNGWLLINGGKVSASACSFSGDAGIDSDMGIYITGGEVAAGGNMLDHIAGGEQNYAVFNFTSRMAGGTEVTLKDADGLVVGSWAPVNDYTYLIVAGDALVPGTYTLWQGETQLAGSASEMRGMMPMGGFGDGEAPDTPQGMTPPEGFDAMATPPEAMERPEGMEMGETPPELPEGMEMGETPPELPEGMEMGETPPEMPEGMERPEGFDPGQMRGFGGGRGGRGGFGGAQGAGEASTEFVLTEGGATFASVGAAEK